MDIYRIGIGHCGFTLWTGLHWQMYPHVDKGYNGRGIQRLVPISRIQNGQASVASQVDGSINLSRLLSLMGKILNF